MLIIALAIVAALFVAGLQGSGQTAGAASHTPVVQVTPEDAHWYDRNALVETASGRLVVAYSGHLREGDCCLYSKTSDDGGNTWSAPLFVGDGNAGGLAATGGKTWLVYFRHQDNNHNIYYRTSDDQGDSWSAEGLVADNPDLELSNPAILGSRSGRVIVTWQANTPEGSRIEWSTTDDGGATWDDRGSLLDHERVFKAHRPDLAQTPSGDIWVIYNAFVQDPEREGQWGLWYQVSSDDGETWSGPERLQDSSCCQSIAGTPESLALTWSQGKWNEELGFHNEEIYYRTSADDGATWSEPVRYTMFPGFDGDPDVTGLAGGGFALLWWSDRQHASVEYTQARAIWFGNPDTHEDNDYPPAVVRTDHSPIPNPRAGRDAFIEATVIGDDVASVTVEWSVDGEDEPDMPMNDDGDGRYSAALPMPPEPGRRIEYLVRVDDFSGDVMRSNTRGFELVAAPEKRHEVLLVVDDRDRWQVNHIAPYYKRALNAGRTGYDFWDTSVLGVPMEGDLLPYVHGAVIWSVPDYNPWLWRHPDQNAGPNAITAFLNEGGSLFMSGHQIAQHYRDRGQSTWLADHLRVERADCCPSDEVGPMPGSIFGGLPDFTMHGGSGANNSHSPDPLRPLAGAVPLLNYVFPGDPISPHDAGPRGDGDTIGAQGHDDPSRAAAVGFRQGQSRVVFFGFNFESIPSAKMRRNMMARVMQWINPTCAGRASTIDGNHGPNVINGTPGDDVIVGLGGNDQIFGWDGDDIICGSPQDDVIDGGNGSDWIASFDGDDILLGGPGDDALRSGPGNDLLQGNSGNDLLAAGPGRDKAWGGSGNDRIMGQKGKDTLLGQAGDDLILGGRGRDRIKCGSGNDIAQGGKGRDTANRSCEVQAGIP